MNTGSATVVPPLSERLRALLVNQASEATLTCTFVPGGKFGGVGIRSHLYCANCSQGLIWHEVAAGLALILIAEAMLRDRGGVADLSGLYDQLDQSTALADALAAIVARPIPIPDSGESRGGSSV